MPSSTPPRSGPPKRPDNRGHLQKRRARAGQTAVQRKAFEARIAALALNDLFDFLPTDQRLEVEAELKRALLTLPFLRRLLNHLPTPAQVVAELDAVAQRLIDASVYMRGLESSTMFDETIERIARVRLGYEALKSPGKRPGSYGDRGLQSLACSIEQYLQQHYIPDMPQQKLRRLIVSLLDRAGEMPSDKRSRNVTALFTPSRIL